MIIDYNKIIKETDEWVKKFMENYDNSHDYNHVIRVKNMALKIADNENLNNLDKFKIILSSLTHDIADNKYTNDLNEQERLLKIFFKDKLNTELLNDIIYVACNTSLSKEIENIEKIDNNNIILKCVQDADRIDSLGSIGISRYFIYGIKKKNSNMEQIINNLKNRTKIIKKFIKTSYGKKIAKKKYKIIKKFIKDYKTSI